MLAADYTTRGAPWRAKTAVSTAPKKRCPQLAGGSVLQPAAPFEPKDRDDRAEHYQEQSPL